MGLDSYWYLRKSKLKYPDDLDARKKILAEYPEAIREIAEDQHRAVIIDDSFYEIGYFRKVNAMHHWVVENCADGHDICQDIFVSVESAKDLLEACEKVLAAKADISLNDEDLESIVLETLPPSDGFFFGSTNIDDWYFKDIEQLRGFLTATIAFLTKSSDDDEEWDLIYRASW